MCCCEQGGNIILLIVVNDHGLYAALLMCLHVATIYMYIKCGLTVSLLYLISADLDILDSLQTTI